MTGSGFSSYRMAELRERLRPLRLHWFPKLGSTNEHAAELRRRGGLFAPAVVLTGRQTAGRGRGMHAWWSGRGCVTATFVLPVGETVPPHQLPLLAGMAVRGAGAELTGNDRMMIKWPNDVLFEGRKVAGLLCERVQGADLVGLGLNVNLDPAQAPGPLRDRITSLAVIAGGPVDMTEALVTVAAHLQRTIARRQEEPFAALLREYDAHHALLGRNVGVLDGGGDGFVSGRCEGLDEMGRLLLRSRQGLHRIVSGQVQAL